MKKAMQLMLILGTVVIATTACTGGNGQVVVPETPDGTIKAVADNLAAGQPQVMWMALPPSYQQDITDLTHTFATKMDPELYNKVFTVANKAITVLTDKRDIILSSSMLEMAGDEQETIKQSYDTVMAFLGTLFTSELSDLEKLKTIDYKTFLETTGAALMDQAAAMSANNPEDPYTNEFKAKLEATTVEVVASEGDQATVKITTPDEDPEEMIMVKVEDRWVPKEMADDWAKDIEEAKKELEELTPEKIAQGKMQAMMALAMVESMIDQVATVNSAEEFDALVGGMFGSMLGGLGQNQDDMSHEMDEDQSAPNEG